MLLNITGVIGLARTGTYRSLHPIEAYLGQLRARQGRKPCCGQSIAVTGLPQNVIRQVVGHSSFHKEMVAYKESHGADRLVVNLGVYRGTF